MVLAVVSEVEGAAESLGVLGVLEGLDGVRQGCGCVLSLRSLFNCGCCVDGGGCADGAVSMFVVVSFTFASACGWRSSP